MIRILLIEDDTHIAQGVQFFLEEEGFQVKVAEMAKDAMHLLRTEDFQLAILDVTLPDGNGFELFQEMKARKELPVIFLTALDGEEEIVKGFELGADEYITKPFRPRELLSRIKNVIRHAGILEENKREIQIEHVKLNLEQGTVFKSGEQIELTSLEYKILAFLFENKGRILTRGQILSGIWDESGNFVNNNTLTVYIKRLREKIEEDPNVPKVIKTVRGIGYKAGV